MRNVSTRWCMTYQTTGELLSAKGIKYKVNQVMHFLQTPEEEHLTDDNEDHRSPRQRASAGDLPSAMTNSFTSRTQVVDWIRPSVELDQQLSGVKQPHTFSDSVRRETLINKCERHRHTVTSSGSSAHRRLLPSSVCADVGAGPSPPRQRLADRRNAASRPDQARPVGIKLPGLLQGEKRV